MMLYVNEKKKIKIEGVKIKCLKMFISNMK